MPPPRKEYLVLLRSAKAIVSDLQFVIPLAVLLIGITLLVELH